MADERIQSGQGAGGELMQTFLTEILLPRLNRKEGTGRGIDPELLDDSATFGDLAFTIDGHTVWPLEFPGGDIGSLSVCGTVNDLAVVGAVPEALALSLVLEEGLSIDLLKRVMESMGRASKEANVEVITGDTKVVETGGVKGMVSSTAGIGSMHPHLKECIGDAGREGRPRDLNWLRDDASRPGDHIILSGSVGDHGISLISFREGYGFETDILSDIAPMTGIMDRAIKIGGVASAKDLTRGGLSNGLNEWARKTGNEIVVIEESIPVKVEVMSACDMLGMDPFEIGNEGKVILSVADGHEEEVLRSIRSTSYGKDASIIGRVMEGKPRVILETSVGGRRIMDPPYGDPVPRIC